MRGNAIESPIGGFMEGCSSDSVAKALGLDVVIRSGGISAAEGKARSSFDAIM